MNKYLLSFIGVIVVLGTSCYFSYDYGFNKAYLEYVEIINQQQTEYIAKLKAVQAEAENATNKYLALKANSENAYNENIKIIESLKSKLISNELKLSKLRMQQHNRKCTSGGNSNRSQSPAGRAAPAQLQPTLAVDNERVFKLLRDTTELMKEADEAATYANTCHLYLEGLKPSR